jgi:filamentous hemagglutinin
MNATVVVRSDAAASSGAAAPPAAGSTALAGGRIVAVPGTDAPGAAVQAGAAGTPAAAGLLAVRRTSEVAAAEATAARVDAADGAHVGGSAAATDAPLSGSVIAASARTHQATAIDTVQAQFATAAAALPVRYTITARGPPALVGGALPTAPETIDGRSAAAPGAVKAAGYTTVRSAVALALPASQLFRIPAHAGVHYLVETDPAFTNYQNFLSSDYFLTQLKLDPERSLKRYTDGFGEQRLLDDQIMALTGRRFLSGYADTQSEYTALMASGVAFAQQYHLTPGTTLSAEQMAQLTTDIVWLENQSVTLADGSTTTALVPRVYLRQPQAGDLGPTGSLIAARDITLTTPGDLVNSGTLRAHGTNAAADDGTLALRADNLTNSGTLTAGTVTAQARTDLANLGGQIVGIGAGSNVMLAAGRDLILRTTTQTHTATTATSTSSRTNADRIATVQGGSVSLQAARDLLSHGATVAATAGDLQASAGRDLVVAAVDERYSLEIGDPHGRTVNGQRTRTAESRSTPLGSSLGASGNLRLSAGADATVLGSTVAAGRNLEISGADVTVGAATASESFAATGVGRHDFHSASETRTTAVGSRLTAGRELAVTANGKPADGQGDIAVQGSSLNAGTGTLALAATRDLAIGTAATSSAESGADYNRSRGLLSTTTGQSSHERTTAGVQGSSLGGATVIASAGRDLGVTGSSVVADGNLTLLAGHDLNIAAATETTRSDSSRAQSKSGLMGSGGIGFMVGSRVQEAAQQGSGTTSAASTVGSIGGNVTLGAGNAYRQTGSDVIAPAGDIAIVARTVAITESRDSADSRTEQKFRQSGLTVAVTAPVISALQSAIGTAEATGATRDGRMAALGAASTALSLHSAAGAMQSASAAMDAGKGVGEAAHIGISITAGSSHSTTTTTQHSNTARDSTLQAGGNLRIDASGAGRDSGITLQGTRVMAGQDVDLKAEGDIALRAARNNSEQHTRSASNSAAAGVAITFGPNGAAFGITASASGARGKADGTDTTWSNTRIDAGRRVGLQSGGDTTLRGASVAAPKISAQVGGDLKIESLQDTSRYASKNQSLGGSVTLGIGASGSASASSAKVHADYASVTEQSGLKAGDGGFQIHVGGATNLRGGALTSSEAAVQSGANRFASAGGLTTEDLRNRDDYRASGASLSGGYGKADGSSGGLQKFTGGMNGGAAGIGSASGHQSNTTASAISGVAGDTRARTDGKRDAALTRNWDGSQLEREVQAQTQITAAFGQQASKAVGDYATQQYDRLKDNDPSEAEKWKEGGAYRIAAHSVIGGLTGGLQGALGAGTSQAVIDQIAKQIASTDLPPGLKTALTAIAGTSVGAAVGGSAGTAAAGNATVNNYLNHVRPNPMRLSEVERYEAAAAACGHGDAAACETRNALAQTSVQRDRELAQACSGSTPGACAVKVGEATAMGNTVRTTESGYVFAASPTLTPLNPSTIGNPKRPDSLHDTLAQSTADGLLVEVGNQAVAAVVAPLVKATGAVIGAVKGSVGDLTPSTTAVAATDGSATSVYSSDGRAYGSTALTDAKGNVIPTQPALQSTSGNGGVGAKGIDKIFEAGRTPKASELKEYAEAQGWKPSQTDGGPLKYVDENGIPRVTIKQGSSRAPGSSDPHVEFKDATGQRTDAFGNPVTRKSLGNHTSIDFDL